MCSVLRPVGAWTAVALLVFVVACPSDSDEVPSCTSGETRVCACTDGREGNQVCNSLGGYDPCTCDGITVLGDAGSDVVLDGEPGDDTGAVGDDTGATPDVVDEATGDADGVDLAEAGPDFSGTYLLGAATTIAPSTPLLFQVEVAVSTSSASVDMIFQALKTDTLPSSTEARPDARTPVGDTHTINDSPYASDGSLTIVVGEITIHGDANPISGSSIVADLTFVGSVLDQTSFCGALEGDVTVPLSLDLAGSTFGAVATEDPTATTVMSSCP